MNAEISTVIYDIPYRDVSGLEILTSVGIKVFNLSDAIINNKTL